MTFSKLILAYVCGSVLTAVVVMAGLNLHFKGEILFYKGMFIISLGTVLTWLLMYRVLGRSFMGHINAIASIAFALVSVFFVLIPVSLDRSVSVFLLGYMNADSSKDYSKKDLSNAFGDIYMNKYGAIDRRVQEQLASGNIMEINEGRYVITPQGKKFIKTSTWIADAFGIDKKFLEPSLGEKAGQ